MFAQKLALTAAGFAAGVAMTVATFGYTAAPVAADQDEATYMLAQKAQVIAVTYQLDMVGLHGMEDDAAAGKITSGALGKVRRARIALEATAWPEPLKAMATEQVAAMKAMEEAIRSEDAAKVIAPAKKAHDVGHDLSDAVYSWLGGGSADAMPSMAPSHDMAPSSAPGAAPASGHGH